MKVQVLKHYSYRVMQKFTMNFCNKQTIHNMKKMISEFIEADKEDKFLTFAEYYIFFKDKDGYMQTYHKEVCFAKDAEFTLKNINFVINLLKQIEKENETNKEMRITTYINN